MMLQALCLPNSIGEKPGELRRSNKMAGLLERRNHLISQFKVKPSCTATVPSPPHLEINEVDESDNKDYRFEEVRLQSFENWPNPHVSPELLAKAGFYYLNQIDRVRCFECSTEICRWEGSDDPFSEHQRWAGRCRFIRKLPCGNVPIGADPAMIPARPIHSQDIFRSYGLEYRLGAVADTYNSFNETTNTGTMQFPTASKQSSRNLGMAKPDFSDYATYAARLATFTHWPTSIAQTKEQLADAGFFYTGTGDQTTCYYCGGGLKDWEPQDDPWVQHAKWFSTCFYVRLMKGQDYINSITGKHVPQLSEEELSCLASCIKKVECLTMKKCESKEETQNSSRKNDNNAQVSALQSSVEEESNASAASSNETLEHLPSVAASTNIATELKDKTEIVSSIKSTNQQQPSERKLTDDTCVCKICYNEPYNVIFFPCSHICACTKCAASISVCAVCREPVTMMVRAYLA